MASLDSQGEIVPVDPRNPEETQIRKGHKKQVRPRLQLLLVYIVAFI